MTERLKKKGTTVSIVIVLAILLVLNLISVNAFTRVDLTDSGIYSLSEASKDLMRNLPDRILVKCYFTDDLPAPYNQNARYLKDQLADYRAYSGGRLQFEFVDPAKDGKEEEAMSYRIPPVQVNAYESDRLEIKKVYMGIAFLYGDKTEVMPVLQSTAGLEYEISRAIKKITSARIPRIAFVSGHGEPDLQQQLRNINSVLSREYNIQSINLSEVTEVPSDIDALLVISPKQAFSEWELFVLDQYLMSGGHAGFFIDNFACDIQNNSSNPIDAGLGELLSRYGIGVNSDLVLDASCSRIGIQQQSGFFRIQNMVEFHYFPLVTELVQENVIVKGLDGINFTFISSLDTTVAVPAGVEREIFARSSEIAAVETESFDLSPYRKFSRAFFSRKDIPLAAILTGTLPSYFSDKSIPAYKGTDSTFNPESVSPLSESVGSRILVIGDGDFVEDRNMSREANLVFFMNVADWLSQDEGLISIRSKNVAARPLEEVSDGTKKFVKYLNILAMPLLVIVIGVVRWQMRRSAKKRRL